MRALVPPIYPSNSYERDEQGLYPGKHSYARDQNPTYDQVEHLLAALEGGEQALVFSSGMAAATTLFECLRPGAHVIVPRCMYWTIRMWLENWAKQGRIELSIISNHDVDELRNALQPGKTQLVWVETPSNPQGYLMDIAKVSEIAKQAGAMVIADNTSSTPVHTKPLDHGADIVMHSATKQLNGHGDLLAGALITARRDAFWELVCKDRAYRGNVLGSFEAWLLLRGMRTLFLRVHASSQRAQKIAEALQSMPHVHEVLYPGLASHPGHEIAKKQMVGGFGALVSFRVQGGAQAARFVASHLRLFKNATSLGSVESLVEHRAPIEGSGTPVPDDLLRLSVGIEDVGDLIHDLQSTLEQLSAMNF
jgi:cystathionine gamma-synthase